MGVVMRVRVKVNADTDLPPFNESAVCVKCGFGDIHSHYYQAEHASSRQYSVPEHIIRQCIRCGFEWAEAPIV